MCQPLLTMKPTVIPCDPKIRYNQTLFYLFLQKKRFINP